MFVPFNTCVCTQNNNSTTYCENLVSFIVNHGHVKLNLNAKLAEVQRCSLKVLTDINCYGKSSKVTDKSLRWAQEFKKKKSN